MTSDPNSHEIGYEKATRKLKYVLANLLFSDQRSSYHGLSRSAVATAFRQSNAARYAGTVIVRMGIPVLFSTRNYALTAYQQSGCDRSANILRRAKARLLQGVSSVRFFVLPRDASFIGHGLTHLDILFRTGTMLPSAAPTEPVDKGCCEIKRRITNLLWQRGVSSLRRLDIVVADGTVTLRGTVRSFYERQLCLVCTQHVPGVFKLVDDIKVEWLPESAESSAATA